jgi:hypothetical protein
MQQLPAGNEMHLTHLFLLGGHHDCFPSNQRPGVAWQGRPTRARYTVRPDCRAATTTFAIGCLPATLSHTAFKSQEKSLRCRSSCYWLAVFSADTAFLQSIGEHYPATGQDQIIFFGTKDRMSARDSKAVSASAALDRNQPTTKFSESNGNRDPNYGENSLRDRSSGIGPMHGIEP